MKRFKSLLLLLFLYIWSCAQTPPETFSNPVIPGFHPDPTICRVGEDYYLVNSSFEWFPGLPVYHSRDLVNWKLIGHGITRPDQVELPSGLGDSRGLYAPAIRYHDGLFYIINTCVNCNGNFYITAKDPAGPWSDPVWLNTPGIDPSLFWDDDGRCYYTGHANISGPPQWPEQNGVWMQELDLTEGKMTGKRVQLTFGHATNAHWTEGPHLYKINGKYLLLVAEGGTGFHHAVTIFHSDSLWGPYIPDHSNPVLTHRHLGNDYPIHSVGHADIVETQNGEWWAVMLAKRKIDSLTYLGRETFLTPLEFEGITPVFNPGVGKVLASDRRPDLPWTPLPPKETRDDFNADHLSLDWNFLRSPKDKWHAVKNGKLVLNLRPEVLDSLVNPSFVARRIQHHNFTAGTSLKLTPKSENEKAGLALYRASGYHYQLLKEDNYIVLYKTFRGVCSVIERIPYKNPEVVLKVESAGHFLKFWYGKTGKDMERIGPDQPFSVLADEYTGGFTGPFVGMYATSSGKNSSSKAFFDWFDYSENPNK